MLWSNIDDQFSALDQHCDSVEAKYATLKSAVEPIFRYINYKLHR